MNIFEEIRDSVISLDDLFEKSNNLFKEYDLDFNISYVNKEDADKKRYGHVRFSDSVSCSHVAPFGRSRNWHGVESLPKGFPGLTIRLNINFKNSYDKHKDSKLEGSYYNDYNSNVKKLLDDNNILNIKDRNHKSFDKDTYSSIIRLLGLKTSCGGGGGNRLSYDTSIFFEDFKLLNKKYEEFNEILSHLLKESKKVRALISIYKEREKVLQTTNIATYISRIDLKDYYNELVVNQRPENYNQFVTFYPKLDDKYNMLEKAVLDNRKNAILKDQPYIKKMFKTVCLKPENYTRFKKYAEELSYVIGEFAEYNIASIIRYKDFDLYADFSDADNMIRAVVR